MTLHLPGRKRRKRKWSEKMERSNTRLNVTKIKFVRLTTTESSFFDSLLVLYNLPRESAFSPYRRAIAEQYHGDWNHECTNARENRTSLWKRGKIQILYNRHCDSKNSPSWLPTCRTFDLQRVERQTQGGSLYRNESFRVRVSSEGETNDINFVLPKMKMQKSHS
jgi:hypothetical protein